MPRQKGKERKRRALVELRTSDREGWFEWLCQKVMQAQENDRRDAEASGRAMQNLLRRLEKAGVPLWDLDRAVEWAHARAAQRDPDEGGDVTMLPDRLDHMDQAMIAQKVDRRLAGVSGQASRRLQEGERRAGHLACHAEQQETPP
jgi:hypothetical protein